MKPEKEKKKEKITQPVKKTEPSKGLGFMSGIFFNLIGGALAVLFIYVLFAPWPSDADAPTKEAPKPNIQGYYWLYHIMLKGNFETIEKYPNLTIPQRYEAKWGGEIAYINRIKQSTPDSAVIIIPPRKLLTQAGFKSAVELPWLTYFVYPRKVVYEDDKDSSKIYNQANYILAVNGWGFDKVNYHIDRPEAFMILPLKK